MANKDEKLSTCMITQAWLSDHWDSEKWDADDIDKADLSLVTQKIAKYLSDAGAEVVACYGITHDRDTREVWNNVVKSYVVETKHLHGHWVVKFKNRETGLSLSNIAAAVGLAPQFVERAGKGRYAYDNMLSYLIHAKDADKFNYAASDVVSVTRGEPDYSEIYAERKSAWEKGRAKKAADKARSSENVDELYEKVVMGEVTYEQIQLSDDYYRIYAQNILKFDKGFEAYRNRRMAIASDRMNRGELRTKVLYIQGVSRSGKSKFAKELAEAFVRAAHQRGLGRWEWGKGGAVNPTEQYHGQEVFVMNDLREQSMRPEDWLRLLDPENDEAIYGRYKSKVVCPEWIIITCHMDVYDFFNAIRGQSKHFEPMDQFIGRLMARLVVVNRDDVRLYPQIEYDDEMYLSQTNRPIDVKDGHAHEVLHYGFSEGYLPLPNATDLVKMEKFADFLISDGDLVGLVETKGVSLGEKSDEEIEKSDFDELMDAWDEQEKMSSKDGKTN